MVLKQGGMLVVAGLVPGLLLAYVGGTIARSRSSSASRRATSPTFAAAVFLVALMAVAGTLLPALRAVRVDPIRAIRAE